MFKQYRESESMGPYPKCVARDIDPEVVAIEEILVKPRLNGVAGRKKSLHSLNHAPDLRQGGGKRRKG